MASVTPRRLHLHACAGEGVRGRQRLLRTEGVAQPLGHEREPDEAVSVQPTEHARRERAGGDPAKQVVVGHEERCLERLEALDAHAVPGTRSHPPELEVTILTSRAMPSS